MNPKPWQMEDIEAEARAICRADALDPDEKLMQRFSMMPRWRMYHGKAVVALEARRQVVSED